ncbi:MAG: membrane protein insertion efficiency factor YidD [Bacteroidales bacterium]|jgi:putative membrane protein insertion efficiency factor|nr:membrane protein insertion efficiency factor YidD [Bacteroidales bacterium]
MIFRILLPLSLSSAAGILPAQHPDIKTDMIAIKNKLSDVKNDHYKRSYIYEDEVSLVKKLNPLNAAFGGAMFVYQNVLSKHLSSGCLYTPTCSEFSKQAVREYGIIKGTLLSFDRLSRCNPLTAAGLKNISRDPKTNRYPDPVSDYKRSSGRNANKKTAK